MATCERQAHAPALPPKDHQVTALLEMLQGEHVKHSVIIGECLRAAPFPELATE